MNRSTRTFIVVGIALVVAALSTYVVLKVIRSLPPKEVEVAHVFAVVASRPLPLGTMIAASDVKRVPWPAASQVPGGFADVDQVVNRGVIAPVAENEPITATNLASREAGAGLPPTIPPGMRAISVKVNEVIGVAGFVVPSTRVDVMVILTQGGTSVARVVVSNVQVLASGTKYDQDAAKQGQAIPSSVVTLMVTPDDAERIALAANQGQIQLTLRNPMDTAPTASTGTRTASLVGDAAPVAPAPRVESAPRPVVRRVVEPAPPPPVAAPAVYAVEAIRGAKRSEETVK